VRLFEGYEAEGRFRGIKTLFVADEVPWDNISRVLDLHTSYGQIYFGADDCSAIDWNVVNQCTQILPVITVELGDNNLPKSNTVLLHGYVHPILNVDRLNKHALRELLENNVNNDRTQVKFETETKCYLAPIKSFIQNWKTDIQKDKELWRLK
jgi:hypothetical protein